MSVMDWLSSLLPTSKTVDSQAQLDAAKRQQASATAAQNQMARSRGFDDYQAMAEWERQRAHQSGGTTGPGRGSYAKQGVDNLRAMHPATMLDGVAKALKDANNQGN